MEYTILKALKQHKGDHSEKKMERDGHVYLDSETTLVGRILCQQGRFKLSVSPSQALPSPHPFPQPNFIREAN